MAKSVADIYKRIIIYKVFVSGVIWRIYVDKVNLAFVCLFKQLQRSEVVALDEKVHLTAIVDEKAAVLGQDGRMCRKHLVDFLAVFLKDKSVFLRSHVLFKLGEVGEQVRRVFVLRRGRNIGANRLYFGKQIFTLLLRYVGTHISASFLFFFSISCLSASSSASTASWTSLVYSPSS